MSEGNDKRRSTSRSQRALVALLDAIHAAPEANPHAKFQKRFAVGGSLLGMLVALPGLGVSLVTADRVDAALTAALLACLGLHVVAIRLRAPMAILIWTLLGSVACFLVTWTLLTRALEPQQLFWLALLPLAAQALAGPRADEAGPAGPSRAPLVAVVLVLALGVSVIAAHALGFTLDRPGRALPRWALAIDFAMFLTAAYGLVYLYELSVRETQVELAQLRRLFSVCAWCKKIRHQDDWIPLERYLARDRRHELSHGICPACFEREFPGGTRRPAPER